MRTRQAAILNVMEKAKKGSRRWRLLREIEPGQRFQTRYKNHPQLRERGDATRYGRLLNVVDGSALIVAGLAFLPLPVPATSLSF